ncbi:dihydroorotate dehydrogenase electron transfer subunit [Staphylococcus felis]|uniref:Dihydroorotate dehydrogenase B (NAD(+)), electron transfer subunit n=1 Tax=Staphylococcus felis TaxID=46127 RepID=A0AAX1RV33_9STAP|nr:dihydroorotate dehydrogenase electron transfer subunit [Staphylococcus felis]AVP36857.1 dihydroorotate dehydrogenase electron transfer subunit [Staphylococcus felis]MBH9579827.1 dihydroorotate dehydrogenase electron transfer subunit [Staphylococcus felis]MDM8326887.1 dihydroorotate dehydrogenase electron transfer subunit [Staphylococcus felis]MDQ7192033.1 dihydroorotate dehydrogenase electron transfer subunit [Staphylococcus felis]PNZ35902.1 dihydroorotate dehydrogenase electron transfer su
MEKLTVISNEKIADRIYELKVTGPVVEQLKQPGQFVHIKAGQGSLHMLRRPISICEINTSEKSFTMLFRAEGAGTEKIAALSKGDEIDILAPLGNGFPVDKAQKKALLVGGGIGVPPLYELSKQLTKRGIEVVHVLGFRSKKDVFYQEQFEALGQTYIATEDGSLGEKGFVTNVIDQLPVDYDIYYTCGPKPMLKALTQLYTLKDVPGYISLEERMGCGVGACYACVCHVPNSTTDYVKVCTDGPVFEKGAVVL